MCTWNLTREEATKIIQKTWKVGRWNSRGLVERIAGAQEREEITEKNSPNYIKKIYFIV